MGRAPFCYVLVLGALLSAASSTQAAEITCGEKLNHIYYHGFNLDSVNAVDADECCELCADYSGCVLYTYFSSSSTGQSICYFKSAAGEKTNYGDSSSVTAVSAFMEGLPTPSPTPSVTPAPTSECSAEGAYCGNSGGTTCCDSTSYCQPWNNDYYQCIGLPDGCGDLETDVDYYGNDLSSALTLYPWLCCSLCQETEGCNAYTFVNLASPGPTCYMKTSAAGRVASIGALSGKPLN